MLADQKKIESYFSDRLTFSNIRGRTSHFIDSNLLYLSEGWHSYLQLLNSIGKYHNLVN